MNRKPKFKTGVDDSSVTVELLGVPVSTRVVITPKGSAKRLYNFVVKEDESITFRHYHIDGTLVARIQRQPDGHEIGRIIIPFKNNGMRRVVIDTRDFQSPGPFTLTAGSAYRVDVAKLLLESQAQHVNCLCNLEENEVIP